MYMILDSKHWPPLSEGGEMIAEKGFHSVVVFFSVRLWVLDEEWPVQGLLGVVFPRADELPSCGVVGRAAEGKVLART